MPTYLCPRCNATEGYAKTETVVRAGHTGLDNTTKMKNVQETNMRCKACTEVMNIVYSEEEIAAGKKARQKITSVMLTVFAVWSWGWTAFWLYGTFVEGFELSVLFAFLPSLGIALWSSRAAARKRAQVSGQI